MARFNSEAGRRLSGSHPTGRQALYIRSPETPSLCAHQRQQAALLHQPSQVHSGAIQMLYGFAWREFVSTQVSKFRAVEAVPG
jgi:hypothetical protein